MEKLKELLTIKNALKMMVLVLPLFFISHSPLQLGADNYGKYFLFGIATLALWIAFLFRKKKEGRLAVLRSPLDQPLALLLAAALAASLFGANLMNSFFGNLSSTVLPFFPLLFFAMYYRLVYCVFQNEEDGFSILRMLLVLFSFISAVSFVVVFFYASHSLSAYLRLMAGSSEDLSVYLANFLVLVFAINGNSGMRMRAGIAGKKRAFLYLAIALALLALIRIDFHYAWWILLSGSLSIVFIRFKHGGEAKSGASKFAVFKAKYLGPSLLALLAVNFLLNFYLVNGTKSLHDRLVMNRQLSNAQSVGLLKGHWLDNLFFGVGLENADYAFSLYRNRSMNSYEYWDVRFINLGDFFLYLLISGGICLGGAFLYLVFAIIKNIIALLRAPEEENRGMGFPVMLIPLVCALVLSFLLYSANFNILLLFFTVLALFFNSFGQEEREKWFVLNFKGSRNNAFYSVFSVFAIFVLIYTVFSAKFVLADYGLGRTDRSEKDLLNSANLSPARYEHDLEAAKMYVKESKAVSQASGPENSLDLQKKALDYLHLAETQGENSVVAMETAGSIYRDYSEGGDGLNIMAIKAFEKAVSLEPTNPVLLSELGEARLRAADYQKAEDNFRKALDMKENYRQAELGLAKAMAKNGKKTEGVELLKKIAKESGDADVYYELGVLYFNDGENKEAIASFNSAVTLSPLNSNALYGLALALEKNGDKKQALYYFKKVQKLNPKNAEIANKIADLEKK